MDSLLDSIRKDIDMARADLAVKEKAYVAASKAVHAAEINLNRLVYAEINLEYEMKRMPK